MKAKAIFTGNKVVVSEEQDVSRIYNKGRFGEIVNKKLELSLVEALYLMNKGDLEIRSESGRKLSFDSFVKRASKIDPKFWIRYSVYSDIRKRGYITKTALKYGADFRVYDRGTEPGKAHAKWILYAVSESESFDWRKFAAMMRVAHSVRKKLLIGILDDEGDVTYYEVSWKRP